MVPRGTGGGDGRGCGVCGAPRAQGCVPAHGVRLISLRRETDTDSQASGGSDSGDWIFTIREKDPKSLENGALQPSDLERNKVTLARTTATDACWLAATVPMWGPLMAAWWGISLSITDKRLVV